MYGHCLVLFNPDCCIALIILFAPFYHSCLTLFAHLTLTFVSPLCSLYRPQLFRVFSAGLHPSIGILFVTLLCYFSLIIFEGILGGHYISIGGWLHAALCPVNLQRLARAASRIGYLVLFSFHSSLLRQSGLIFFFPNANQSYLQPVIGPQVRMTSLLCLRKFVANVMGF